IGIIGDARVNNIHEEPRPMAYYSLEQMPTYANTIEIRMQGDPQKMENAVRRAIRQAAPELPVMRISRLTDQVESNLLRESLIARLASAFAMLALGLACLGIYGVLSYATTRRTSEIGIRLALGAEGGDVRWMILRDALMVLGIGLAIGVPCAVAIMRVAGCAAALIPAWRASRIEPSVALRYE